MVLSFFTGGAGMMSWCRRERFQWNQEVKPLVFANSCVSVRWKFCSMLLLTLSRRPLSEGIKKTIKIMVSFWSGQLRVWLHHETFWYEINRNNAATCKELLPFSLSWTLGMAMQHYGEWVRESEIQKIRYIHSQRSCGIVVFVTARKLPEFLCRSIRHPLPYRHRIFGEGQLSDGST